MTAIPVILCGKIPSHQVAVPKALEPDYKVVGYFKSVPELAEHFPELMQSTTEKPTAIFMGGGFDRDEFNEAQQIPDITSIVWFRPVRTKPGNEHMLLEAGNAPSAERVAELARSILDEHKDVLGTTEGAGKTWYY